MHDNLPKADINKINAQSLPDDPTNRERADFNFEFERLSKEFYDRHSMESDLGMMRLMFEGNSTFMEKFEFLAQVTAKTVNRFGHHEEFMERVQGLIGDYMGPEMSKCFCNRVAEIVNSKLEKLEGVIRHVNNACQAMEAATGKDAEIAKIRELLSTAMESFEK